MSARKVLLLVLLTAGWLFAQQTTAPPKPAPKPQDIPDAPSATQKPQNFPTLPPPSTPTPEQRAPNPQTQAPPTEPLPPGKPSSSSQPPPDMQNPAPSPARPSTTMARPGRAPAPGDTGRDEMFTLSKNVNFVVVPVTVKDENGVIVDGLLRKDFALYEDGVPQQIQLFTSDPFPLSAAVVIDTSLPDTAFQKIENTLTALAGAFSQFDEIGVYTYGASAQRVSNITSDPETIASAMRKLQFISNPRDPNGPPIRRTGSMGGVPSAGGPLNSSPTINGKPVDPTAPIVPVVRPEPHVLNDAILMAANDLAQRDRSRRRMLFIISDGQERGSRTSYADVMKVLLSHEITVYALAVGLSDIPGYRQLQKFRVPGQGYNDILPKYASATGGDMLTEFGPQGIEQAYSRATEEARNQYTIGYTTRANVSGTYRTIEVRVHRPGLKIFAKDGYYPLPPQRPGAAPQPPTTP